MLVSTLPLTVTERVPAQASVAVTPGSVKTLWHSTLKGLAPASVSTGSVVSITVTVNEQKLLLPLESTAPQYTLVVPSGSSEPESGTQVTATGRQQLSWALALQITGVPDGPAHSTTRFEGHRITGGIVSR